ncbi:TonB-dependent receptor [Sulfurovum sp. TSL6]|uniref:TonB-dependent receptor n=1 Tax=Sulfurovum sp. TSL6 TaxID=2826995 RepID=UPI001CC7B689|nr:TonB-dependent receptor [Sulfurovum sp. TSL6]GIU01692.1 TonB-dependent receptor [Sulfurovum sp. TSL6]
MKTKILTGSIIAAYALLNTPAFAEEVTLDPIVVSADFREAKLSETANSVSVIGEEKIYDKASAGFEEVIGKTPNVNFASGASRAHYIQIRGIGERSQFATPVNPSVGINIDGIEFSQSALAVTLFDVKQIEVLRGPQGTTFGATGMAGVINIQSNEPTKETEGHIEATVGNYNTKSLGAAVGGTLIEDTLLGRFSIYKNTSDGFMKNWHIDSQGNEISQDDTNNIDELTAKAKLRWFASDNHTIDLNYMHLDVDNGYDAFSLDNTRTTHSDEQGKDTQETDAFSLKSTYQLNPKMHLVSKVSHSASDLEYSYDEDWSYVGEFNASLEPYSYFDQYLRDREQTDMDVRLVSDEEGRIFNGSTDWTMGVYLKNYSEDLTRNRRKEDVYVLFTNEYKTKNRAIYGQLDSTLTSKLTLTTGLRAEKWEVSYNDSDNVNINTDENLFGGKIGLQYQHDNTHLYYVSLSKGYKPGGVNAGDVPSPEYKDYQTETLWNIDAGLNANYFENKLISRLNLFYGKRKDQQVKVYSAEQFEFTDYLTNAAEGHYYGLEAELDYYPNDNVHFYGSLGLLKSKFDEYAEYDDQGDLVPSSLEGRAPAHAPEYQYNIGVDYRFVENWTLKANAEGKDSFYFSNTHNEESESYTLFNSSLEYTHENWTATLWVKNITDEDYYVRGFYWYQDPAIGYEESRYTQFGAPRTVGFTVAYDF